MWIQPANDVVLCSYCDFVFWDRVLLSCMGEEQRFCG